jgi:hypothetical protein
MMKGCVTMELCKIAWNKLLKQKLSSFNNHLTNRNTENYKFLLLSVTHLCQHNSDI